MNKENIKKIVKESVRTLLLREGYIEDSFPKQTLWEKFTNILGSNLMMTLLFKYIDENELMYSLFSFLGYECEDMGYENPMTEPEDEDSYDEEDVEDDDLY